jgi:predicted DNA-binding protein
MEETTMIFRVPRELRDKFKQVCKQEQRTMSAQLRYMMQQHTESWDE